MTEEPKIDRKVPTPSWRLGFGVVLVVIGVITLFGQVTRVDLSFWPLAIGAGLLAVWFASQNRGLLIAGSILTGIGVGSLLEDILRPRFEGGKVGLALGFALIALLSRRDTWALFPAAILAVLGLGDVLDVMDVIDARVARIGLPLVVIAIGVLLILRRNLSTVSFIVLMAIFGSTGLLFLAADGSDFIESPSAVRRTLTRSFDIDGVPGKSLRIAGAMELTVITGPEPSAGASIAAVGSTPQEAAERARDVSFDVASTADAIVLTVEDTDAASVSVKVTVPEGTSVEADLSDGGLTAKVRAFVRMDIRTRHGDVVVDVSYATSARSTEISISTVSGDVFINNSGEPSLDLRTASGGVVVDGRVIDGGEFDDSGPDGELRIFTESGDITITREEAL